MLSIIVGCECDLDLSNQSHFLTSIFSYLYRFCVTNPSYTVCFLLETEPGETPHYFVLGVVMMNRQRLIVEPPIFDSDQSKIVSNTQQHCALSLLLCGVGVLSVCHRGFRSKEPRRVKRRSALPLGRPPPWASRERSLTVPWKPVARGYGTF